MRQLWFSWRCTPVFFLFCITVSTAAAQYNKAAPPPEAFRPGFDSINSAQSKQWVSVLAGPRFGGRGTGQAGYLKAAHWVAGKLAEFGFEPIGDRGTYFQHVPMNQLGADMNNSFITGPGGLKIQGKGELGFTTFSTTPRADGKLVIIRSAGGNNVLAQDLNLEGKIVLHIGPDDFRFLREIQQKRPAGIVRVTKDTPANRTRLVRDGRVRFGSSRIDAVISTAAAQRLAAAIGEDVKNLQPRSSDGVDVKEVGHELTIQLRTIREPALIPNVIGWYEGSDPKLKHEYITIGAHLDHLGRRGKQIYPGADDNASGSTAILQIARAIDRNPQKPKRSVLFIAFAAEEMGLIGSRYYCDHPLKPLENMICMLNIDMIGRNEESAGEPASENEDTLHLVGSKRMSTELHELVLRANKHIGLKFEYDEERVFGRSDQASFFNKGIPVTFLFGGFNPHYHRPSDTVQGINFTKIVAAARLNYLTLMMAAEHGRFKKTNGN